LIDQQARPARVINIVVTKAEQPVREVSLVVTGNGAKVPVEAEALSIPSCPRVPTGGGKCNERGKWNDGETTGDTEATVQEMPRQRRDRRQNWRTV
jgi:hypothetical protein